MRLLLDTHVLIWWIEGSGRLGKQTHELIRAYGALISPASVWEISIKSARGHLQLQPPLEEWLPELLVSGFDPLFITFEHALAVRHLPHHHGDPFDRMLVAQAQCEGLTIVTVDPVIAAYGIPTLDAAT
jgi:PIN domain nuclease of toxin-antitoxin system